MRSPTIIVLVLAASLMPQTASAQLGNLKKKIQHKIEAKADTAIDRVFNRTATQRNDSAAAVVSAQATGGSAAQRPGEGVWANYDFVPGARVIFFDDFVTDNVGDFPRKLTFRAGDLEIVEWRGVRFLRGTTNSDRFEVPLPETLPQRFTIEFDVHSKRGSDARMFFSERETAETFLIFASGQTRLYGGGVEGGGRADTPDSVEFARIRLMADGPHVKLYINNKRLANVPNAQFTRTNKLIFALDAYSHMPKLITNIRVAAGGKNLYDALAAEGRVVTQGILFDFGSDRLRPESTPTLKQIGDMLQQHPELGLQIEGHTDNVGDATTNQKLSEQRAAAVVTYLTQTYGMAPARLTAKGFGASKPTAPNTTPEGRQNNRRVELVKL